MQAMQFYQINQAPAITLVLCESIKPDLPEKIQQALTQQGFEAEVGQYATITDAQGLITRFYIGMRGAKDAQALATVVNKLPAGGYQVESPLSDEAIIYWALAQYQFDRYKKTSQAPRVLWVPSNRLDALMPKISAVFTVRDLINTPANDMGPADLSKVVEALAEKHQAQFEQWVGEALLQDGFPAIHAVGRASASQPRLLCLTWGDETHPRITLVGKGVCFDSGGLDLKPSSNMRWMKKDMGGAAQVIGLADWLMTRGVPIRLQVYIPAVENAVGSDAYRPGDVLSMRNGMRVEIDNTDAEGRLVLADAMVKACEAQPDLLIDFATLTGAARTAVGTEISAMFCRDDDLAAAIAAEGERVGDPIWRLPLYAGYTHLFASTVADIANSGSSPYAGAIVAALFLQYFVTPKLPWVHFDIMAWNVGAKPGKPEGGEAMGILAVGEYLIKRYLV